MSGWIRGSPGVDAGAMGMGVKAEAGVPGVEAGVGVAGGRAEAEATGR